MTDKLTQDQIDEIVDLHQKWLKGDPAGKMADFSYMDLSGMDFSNKNLSRANLTRTNLTRAKLTRADLSYADFYRANLSCANFIGANLTNAILYGANFTRAILTGANLTRAILACAILYGANLIGAILTGAILTYANLKEANLKEADLSGIKEDFFMRLALAKNEVAVLYDYLLRGKINGSCYQGECACFVGTVAKIRQEDYKNMSNALNPDLNSATEIFFLAIRAGDTPQNNPVAKIVANWINEFMTQNNIEQGMVYDQ